MRYASCVMCATINVFIISFTMFIRLVLTGSKLLNPILPHVQRLWIMRHMCHYFMCLEFSYGKCELLQVWRLPFWCCLVGWELLGKEIRPCSEHGLRDVCLGTFIKTLFCPSLPTQRC